MRRWLGQPYSAVTCARFEQSLQRRKEQHGVVHWIQRWGFEVLTPIPSFRYWCLGQLQAQPSLASIWSHRQQGTEACPRRGSQLWSAQHVSDTAGDSAERCTPLTTDGGFRRIPWADDTLVAVSVEVWFDLINNKELKPHKDKMKEKRIFIYNLSIIYPPVWLSMTKVVNSAVNRRERMKYIW